MPTYEYACQSCGHDLEAFQRMSDDPLRICPECDEPALKRKIGRGAGIIFKGGGFYETDFKQKKGTAEKSSSEKSESSGETKKEPAKESPKSSEKTTSTDKSS